MRAFSHIVIATCVVGAILALSQPAAAQTVSVEVHAIAASNDGEGVDDELEDMADKLQKVFGNYSTFEQVETTTIEVDKGEQKSVQLPQGSTLQVTFHGFADDLIKLGINVGDKLSTTLRASSGSTFFQAGLEYGDGILILAITPER